VLRDQSKGREKKGREKWTKSSKEKQGWQEDRDMQKGKGNHYTLCWHVALPGNKRARGGQISNI